MAEKEYPGLRLKRWLTRGSAVAAVVLAAWGIGKLGSTATKINPDTWYDVNQDGVQDAILLSGPDFNGMQGVFYVDGRSIEKDAQGSFYSGYFAGFHPMIHVDPKPDAAITRSISVGDYDSDGKIDVRVRDTFPDRGHISTRDYSTRFRLRENK